MAVTFPTDLEIARKARLLPMPEIAAKMGIGPHLLEPYGYDVAKVRLLHPLVGRDIEYRVKVLAVRDPAVRNVPPPVPGVVELDPEEILEA